MKKKLSIQKILITSFAMFSMIFGGGNFILPPLLGIKAADSWDVVAIAFGISGVLIPLMGIIAQAKIQGTVIDFGKKVHPLFALVRNFNLWHLSFFSYTAHSISSLRTFHKGQYRDFFSMVWSYLFFAGDVSLFQPRKDTRHFGRISHSYPTDNHFDYHFRSGIFC